MLGRTGLNGECLPAADTCRNLLTDTHIAHIRTGKDTFVLAGHMQDTLHNKIQEIMRPRPSIKEHISYLWSFDLNIL